MRNEARRRLAYQVGIFRGLGELRADLPEVNARTSAAVLHDHQRHGGGICLGPVLGISHRVEEEPSGLGSPTEHVAVLQIKEPRNDAVDLEATSEARLVSFQRNSRHVGQTFAASATISGSSFAVTSFNAGKELPTRTTCAGNPDQKL